MSWRLRPTARSSAFVARGEIFADFADKETDRERRSGPALRITDTPAREHSIVWSPESDGLVYISDRHGEDEIYGYSFADQRELRITEDLTPKSLPTLSPDEQYLAFVCGHDAIDVINTESRQRRRLARGYFFAARSLAFSPDSRWLAFVAQDDRYFSNVYVQRVDEEDSTPRQITFLSNIHSGGLLWAPNGEFLIFTSCQYRDEDQIVRVDLRPKTPFFHEAEFEKLFQTNGNRSDSTPKQAAATPLAQAAQADASASTIAPLPEPPLEEPDAPPEPPDKEVAPAEEPLPEKSEAAPAPEKKAEKKRVEIVFEGIERRLHLLTAPQMDAYAYAISPDSRDLLFTAYVADKPISGQSRSMSCAATKHRANGRRAAAASAISSSRPTVNRSTTWRMARGCSANSPPGTSLNGSPGALRLTSTSRRSASRSLVKPGACCAITSTTRHCAGLTGTPNANASHRGFGERKPAKSCIARSTGCSASYALHISASASAAPFTATTATLAFTSTRSSSSITIVIKSVR
ncbi:hypothetical protein HC891_12610 [Candidatus Gracilibacteria bacterium]|nr:hypothetical protein [Candidatus Gracilibacteria bacterium]